MGKKGRTSRTGDGNTGRLASRDSKNKSGKRNIDRLREMEAQLKKKDVAIEVLKAECERLVASGHRYGVMVGDKTATLDKKRVDAVIAEVRLALNANLLEVCLTYGVEDEEDGAWSVVIPRPNTAKLKEWGVVAFPCGDDVIVRAVPVVVDGDA